MSEENQTVLSDEPPARGSTGRRVLYGLSLIGLFAGAFFGTRYFFGERSERVIAPDVVSESAAPEPAPDTPLAEPETIGPPPATDAAGAPSAPTLGRRAPGRTRTRNTEPAPAAGARPEIGTLTVDSDVPGASVFIDRVYLGTTPLTANDLTPGSHRLNVSLDGYEGFAQSVEIIAGSNAAVAVRFKEIRLNEAAEVAHKHSFGSCVGRLLADIEGLRYETSHTPDAFTLGFQDLERFDIDYLRNNLQVKRRGGKTYNFADKDGNADRLLVFHRNVQKARLQLQGGQ